MEQTTYRFAPHPSRGVLLGLRTAQLVGLALAAALSLGALHLGGLAGLALALGVSGTTRVGGAHAGRDADAARGPELCAERQRALLGDGRPPAATACS